MKKRTHTSLEVSSVLKEWKSVQGLSSWLSKNGVSANALNLAGLGFALAAGETLLCTALFSSAGQRIAWIVAAFLVLLRFLANVLSEMALTKRATPLGETYGEVLDRLSDAAILLGTGMAVGGNVALGCLAACATIFAAYIGALGKAGGACLERCGPFLREHRMLVVALISLYSGFTPASWQPGVGLAAIGLWVIIAGELVTAAWRIRRGASRPKKATSQASSGASQPKKVTSQAS